MAETVLKEIHFIEDSDDEVFLARLLLESQGLQLDVVHHTTLSQFLSFFDGKDDLPALLVCVDLNMPVIRGDEAIRSIRGQNRFDASVVGICTGSEDPADRKTALEAGAQFFVHKPLDKHALQKMTEDEPKLTLREISEGAVELRIDVR